MAHGRNLWTKYVDQIGAFGPDPVTGNNITVWTLDEEAAEGMEGGLPAYMTVVGNKKLFADKMSELRRLIKEEIGNLTKGKGGK